MFDTTAIVIASIAIAALIGFLLLVVPAIATGRNTINGKKLDD